MPTLGTLQKKPNDAVVLADVSEKPGRQPRPFQPRVDARFALDVRNLPLEPRHFGDHGAVRPRNRSVLRGGGRQGVQPGEESQTLEIVERHKVHGRRVPDIGNLRHDRRRQGSFELASGWIAGNVCCRPGVLVVVQGREDLDEVGW